jgi:hypothetical protein
MDRVLRAILRTDLSFFTRKVFATVSPDETYLHNWHVDAITHQLMRVHSGEGRPVDQPAAALTQINLRLGGVCRLSGLEFVTTQGGSGYATSVKERSPGAAPI